MSTILTKVRNGMLAASVLGTLAFGATQALATPAEAAEAAACNQNACNRQCEAQYGSFASGYCE
ncbi:MAG TPA: hypothetical protein VFR81_23665, partial [Longimicrobium sp.]|nr:hypothetical protein [Longimicrobium sp.]